MKIYECRFLLLLDYFKWLKIFFRIIMFYENVNVKFIVINIC